MFARGDRHTINRLVGSAAPSAGAAAPSAGAAVLGTGAALLCVAVGSVEWVRP